MLRVAPLLSPLGRNFGSLMNPEESTATERPRSSTRQIPAATISRARTARVVPKTCPRRKFGTYPLSARNDFAVFRTQDPSYRHLSLSSGWLFVPELKSYWDGNRAGRRFSSAFNSV